MIDNSTFSTLTAQYVTFGCKLNYAETASIASQLESRGVVAVAENEHPDLIIVNTCTVTSVADKKCRQAIRNLNRQHPDAAIVVTGCYAQLKADEVRQLPGVQLVVGNDGKNRVPELVEEYLSSNRPTVEIRKARDFDSFQFSCSRGNRTRYFLKVQDGCNYFCSYCAIPYARGRSRSPQIEELVRQACDVAAQGGQEIVLTGVNIGHFGWSTDRNFLDLIRELDKVEDISRFRISSIEPELLTDEIIDFVAGSKRFMPHFHVPLQSGSDEVLKLMRRHYDTKLFARKINSIKDAMPDAFIGVDLIVGMRGETRQLFDESERFVTSLPISRLHVFPYSEREGTTALNIPHVVDAAEKRDRLKRMLAVSEAKEHAFSLSYKGKVRPVLFEKQDEGKLSGHTDNYIKVEVPWDDVSQINTIRNVEIGEPFKDINEGFCSDGKMI